MDPRDSRKCLAGVLIALIATLTALPGCHGTHRVVPFEPPIAGPLAPAEDPSLSCPPRPIPPGVALSPFAGDCPMRRPRNILALSGGGAYGAYSAGFMAGWTRTGTRPEFDVVTGISTGALIAPLAFLGPEYDARLGNLYTRVQAADIFKIRTWVTIPFTDAVASSAPLRRLIESEITPEFMNRIAAEHRKGRRLYIGTTNLDTRRLVIWDIGAIACRPCPEGCRLFRDVLLASCAVPGMFPPVRFEVEVDGRKATELHADGGVTAQLFVPSHVFAGAAGQAGEGSGGNGNLYVLVAGKLYSDASPVKAKVLPVLGATTTALLYSSCRTELANLYGLSRAAGLNYCLASLPQEFPVSESSVSFDPKMMSALFAEGAVRGADGPVWSPRPPTLSPGDEDYIRNGLKLHHAPTGPTQVVPGK